jgi:hypothetical protein
MTTSTKQPYRASRVTHFTDIFEDWMLELVLVAAVVAATIQSVLSLSA